MILTIYYMYATFVQWWRLGTLKNKLNGTLNPQNALLVCNERVIYDSKKQRSIENLLFRNDNRIGCTIVPKQKINLSSQWAHFPKNFKHFPILFKSMNHKFESPNIYVLIQAHLDCYSRHESEVLQLEKFGDLIAWKAIEYFELILKTDLDKLTKLVNCFSQNDCDINHDLQLLKIETVNVEGNATKIKYDRKFSKDSTMKFSHLPIHWQDFVSDLKNIYAKIHDINNPKITIENGKVDDVKKVPVSEVKPIKKDNKKSEESKNTLDVSSSDYRRHKDKKDREKSAEKHKKKELKEKSAKEEKIAVKKPEETKNEDADALKVKEKKKEKDATKDTEKKPKEEKRKDETEKKPKEEKKKDEIERKPKEKPPKPGTSKTAQRSSSRDTKKLVKTDAVCEETKPVPPAKKEKKPDEPFLNGDCVFGGSQKFYKPPNILVYADGPVAKENVKAALAGILNRNKYVVYDLPAEGAAWMESTVLVVVCGAVPTEMSFFLMNYLVRGGQLLCLCSDFLYSVLHTFTTAEVREHELVRFSYKDWKQVKMMHHIFCYQASPAKKQFSKDSDTTSNHSGSGNGSSPIAPRTPSAVEIQHNNKDFTIQVQVLGTEETWQTPSLLLALVKGTEGRAIFSQVHLEINPNQYEEDENKFEALKESDKARLEILKDILTNHLEIDCGQNEELTYTAAYFLGRHDLKLKMLSECVCIDERKMSIGDLKVNFLGKDEKFQDAKVDFLPILIHSCPSNFSTVNYFETLSTEHIGRLVIYSDIITSSQAILTNNTLTHGLVVIPKQQTKGIGRSNNTWLSPLGCAMFSVQLHVAMDTALGKRLGLVQHVGMVAVLAAVKKLTCEEIQVGLKWPNDLYAYKSVKIGGIVVSSSVIDGKAVLNIGVGVNLDNSNPTTCVNDIIKKYNEKNGSNIAAITFEMYFATVFNEMENLLKLCESEDIEKFYSLYYKYWLHSDENIMIMSEDKTQRQKAKIVGIDDFGFLKVRLEDGTSKVVQPDGNTFDMMKGLIYPKKK